VDNNIRGETSADSIDLRRITYIKMSEIIAIIIRTVTPKSPEDMVSIFKMLKEVPS